MDKTFTIAALIVTVFTGFLIGYSVPPFIKAGVFSERVERGVASQIDKNLEQHYRKLYETEDK
jgi:hypothetical protein